MVQKQHVNRVVVAKVSPIIKLLVPSAVSFPYYELSWKCLTFERKQEQRGTPCSHGYRGISKLTAHKSWHIQVILARLEIDLGPSCLLSFSCLERNHMYRVGLK